MTGVIKKIMAKGFGFISEDGKPDGDDMFFHFNNVAMEDPNELREGDRVSYEVTEGRKGLEAVDVTLISDDAEAVDSTDEESMPMAA